MTITLKDGTTPRIVISDTGNNLLIGSDISSVTTGINITTLGIGAGAALKTAQEIIAIGKNSQTLNTQQFSNISVGNSAFASLNDSSGDSRFNTIVGHTAFASATTDVTRCIGIGQAAMFTATTTVSKVIAIGVNAGFNITGSTSSSIFIGDTSGTGVTDCSSCTLIGDSATISTASGITNAMALGAGTAINASNAVNIGNACFVGLNNSTPLYSLDIAPISNVAAIRLENSSSTPSTPSSASIIYSKSSIPTYMNSNAVERAIPHRTQVSVSTTTKTFALTDADTFQLCSNGSTQTLTVDTNTNVAFPVDTEIDLFQQGAGQVVIAAAGGVTIQSVNSNLKIAAQYTGATLKKVDTDTWILTGNLTA